jgi:Leucine-rich repeat (LRR) protein
MKGFDKCSNLKSLYISSNRIKKIRGLDKLANLQKIWLDQNRIETLEGLGKLANLKELNISQNRIDSIGTGLDGLHSLHELNISANKVGNFKEVLNLNRLTKLQSCIFSDPHYGDNPICNLCNYQTYILYHLPNLNRLDTMLLSEDAKHFAEATFMKKRMYYNMRIKTIQRNASNISKVLKISKKVRNFKIDIQVTKLLKKLSEVARELEERQYYSKDFSGENETQVCTYGPQEVETNPLDDLD